MKKRFALYCVHCDVELLNVGRDVLEKDCTCGQPWRIKWKEGKCLSCGQWLPLDGFTNTCWCGHDYNSAGQLLAPRSQWGEETGEHLSDILRIR